MELFSSSSHLHSCVLSSDNDLGEDSLRPSQLLGLQAETWNGLDCSATDRPPSFAVVEGLKNKVLASSRSADPQAPEWSRCVPAGWPRAQGVLASPTLSWPVACGLGVLRAIRSL